MTETKAILLHPDTFSKIEEVLEDADYAEALRKFYHETASNEIPGDRNVYFFIPEIDAGNGEKIPAQCINFLTLLNRYEFDLESITRNWSEMTDEWFEIKLKPGTVILLLFRGIP